MLFISSLSQTPLKKTEKKNKSYKSTRKLKMKEKKRADQITFLGSWQPMAECD